jgi:hypothetical protein
MPDKQAVEQRIAELNNELVHAEGTPAEVYSRIVGYYRSVRNWNAGKREEYAQRLLFVMLETQRAGATVKESARPQ